MGDTVTGVLGDCVCSGAAPSAADLYIEVPEHRRVTALRLHRKINAYTRQMLSSRVETALRHGARSLVVDLGHVPFLDAEGIGELLRSQRLVHATTGGTLLLAAVQKQGRKTLAVKGLDSLLAAFPTDADATAFLASWPEASRVRG